MKTSCVSFRTLVLAAFAVSIVLIAAAPASAQDVLYVQDNKVGIGTSTPAAALDVYGYARSISSPASPPTSGKGIEFFFDSNYDWGVFQAFDRSAYLYKNFVFGGATIIFYSGGAEAMRLDTSGRLGLGVPGPIYPLQLANGAYCSVDGHWVDASSRDYKQNIRSLTSEEAERALAGLEPVRYSPRIDASIEHVGFIAEDLPDLVAVESHRGISAVDIVAVLTKVVQEQQKSIDELKAKVDRLEKD